MQLLVNNDESFPASASFHAKIYGDGAVWRHLPIAHFDKFQTIQKGIRMVAPILHYNNRAAPLNKQGWCVQYQANKGESWYDYVSSIEEVSGMAGSDPRQLKTGTYSYMIPSDLNDFFLQATTTSKDDTILKSTTSFLPQFPFLVHFLQCKEEEGRDGFWEIYDGCEYLTGVNWIERRVPRHTRQMWQAAIDILGSSDQHHENPTHIQDIFRDIKNGVGELLTGANKYAPKVAQFAESILPLFA